MIYCPFYAILWQKLLEDQRRLKREQEEADIAARRHTGVIPTHHQFITNERFGDLLNVYDTAKRKSGSEVCFSYLSLLLDPKRYLPLTTLCFRPTLALQRMLFVFFTPSPFPFWLHLELL